MIEVNGKFNTAKIFTDEVDSRSLEQIRLVCDTQAFSGSTIRMMSDVHAGKGCCIGTTMTLTDKVVPSMVGVDIGCGMETLELTERVIDYGKLDETIRTSIPFGMTVRKDFHAYNDLIDLTCLRCFSHIRHEYARHSLGSLGGGNHFIEVDRDSEGRLFLVIHSGSRHLGTEVAEFYQTEGLNHLKGCTKAQLDEVIAMLKAEGREKEIQETIVALKKGNPRSLPVPEELAYVDGQLLDDYLHDMEITQRFALLNRKAMADIIVSEMGFEVSDVFTTIHNYIDLDAMILRKGAVSAREGEKLLIPINMRDGSLICIGKGNPDWNFSAPHGAGRILSRSQAFRKLDVEEYRKQMEGIFTTCVGRDTLDESPMAYKSLDSIVANIGPTVEIEKRIVPVYNFKAGE